MTESSAEQKQFKISSLIDLLESVKECEGDVPIEMKIISEEGEVSFHKIAGVSSNRFDGTNLSNAL